jgi:hypothetical protein
VIFDKRLRIDPIPNPRHLAHGLALAVVLSLGACATYEPYPGPTPNLSPEQKAERYRRFALERNSSGDFLAQGRDVLPQQYLSQMKEPGPWNDAPGWSALRWRDLILLPALVFIGGPTLTGQLGPLSDPTAAGLDAFLVSGLTFGYLVDIFGRLDGTVDQRALEWNRHLAAELDQPTPEDWSPRTGRFDDSRPGWRVGWGFGTAHLSGYDYQEYFTPHTGSLSFAFKDKWTHDEFLDVDYGFGGWTLSSELAGTDKRSDGVHWLGPDTYQIMDQAVASATLRLGRAWSWRFGRETDFSVMPLVGVGVGWLRGTLRLSDASGQSLASFDQSAVAPAAVGGARFMLSTSHRIAYGLELGYRVLKFNGVTPSGAQGLYEGTLGLDGNLRGKTVLWDESGPYMKVGLFGFFGR